jgi:hypothetical protein
MRINDLFNDSPRNRPANQMSPPKGMQSNTIKNFILKHEGPIEEGLIWKVIVQVLELMESFGK